MLFLWNTNNCCSRCSLLLFAFRSLRATMMISMKSPSLRIPPFASQKKKKKKQRRTTANTKRRNPRREYSWYILKTTPLCESRRYSCACNGSDTVRTKTGRFASRDFTPPFFTPLTQLKVIFRMQFFTLRKRKEKADEHLSPRSLHI